MKDFSSIYNDLNLLYTQEAFEKYGRGGYHPVQLGDSYKGGRYTIHHKLGYGGFSTVWLAKDKLHVTHKYCILYSTDILKGSAMGFNQVYDCKH